jgi:hypothetical protein
LKKIIFHFLFSLSNRSFLFSLLFIFFSGHKAGAGAVAGGSATAPERQNTPKIKNFPIKILLFSS